MSDIKREEDSFPWWYTMVKWGIPLGLAFFSSATIGLLLAEAMPVPAFFGTLQWVPILFNAKLDGMAWAGAFAAATTVPSMIIGAASAIFLRGTFLLSVTERLALEADKLRSVVKDLKDNRARLGRALEEKIREFAEYRGQVTGVEYGRKQQAEDASSCDEEDQSPQMPRRQGDRHQHDDSLSRDERAELNWLRRVHQGRQEGFYEHHGAYDPYGPAYPRPQYGYRPHRH